MTSDKDSDMANWRRRNGREKPWKVRYFGVGNENWGCGGNMTPEYYGELYRRFQTYVRSYSGNEIVKVACGPGGPDRHWTEVVMEKVAGRTNAIGLHYYVRGSGDWGRNTKGSATQFDEKEWIVLMKNSLSVDEAITENIAIMDRFDRRKRVALYVDEWGTWWNVEPGTNPAFLYQQNTLRDAVSAGIFLNIFNTHCDRVKMGNIAQINNVLQAMILTRGKEMILTPTYHVFEMFNVHQGATFLPSDLFCHAYEHAGQELPSLVASCSQDSAGTVHISICNLDPNRDAKLQCRLEGLTPRHVRGRVLTADKMNAMNSFARPEAVKPTAFSGADIADDMVNATIPAKSVVVLAVK